jgi:hypothetical protein
MSKGDSAEGRARGGGYLMAAVSCRILQHLTPSKRQSKFNQIDNVKRNQLLSVII